MYFIIENLALRLGMEVMYWDIYLRRQSGYVVGMGTMLKLLAETGMTFAGMVGDGEKIPTLCSCQS